MKKYLALVVTVALVGCASPRTVYTPQIDVFSNPAIGAVVDASPGEPMLSQGRNRIYDAIEFVEPVAMGTSGIFVLPAGKYIKESESSQVEFFSWDEFSRPTNGGITSDGQKLKNIWLFKSLAMKAVCLQTVASKLYCADKEKAPFQRVKAAVNDRDHVQMTLLYSGKVGNKITLSYREFSGDVSRPAFTNAVEYDMNESKVVSYKGAQIEVVDATNQMIRYRVLKNFVQAH
jgi:hypothetical protein